MSGMSVHIQHLVLDSDAIQPGNGQHLARMTGMALERLLEKQGWPLGLAGGEMAEITMPDVNPPLSASDEQTAQELALALCRAFYRMRGNHERHGQTSNKTDRR
jgi:hypothetical protein